MIGKIYYFVSAIVFLLGVFTLLTPSLLTPDFIYPERIDSTYIAFHTELLGNDDDTMLLSPADLNLNYSEIKITTADNLNLNGWFVSANDTPANTILILHDLNESRILYLDHLRQFHDRGLNVCIFDLRAHGSSGGSEFTPGLPAIDDVRLMIDSALVMPGTKNIAIMGVGMGSAIALQSGVYDERCKSLILQSPFNTLENYLDRYSGRKWGVMKNFWYPVFKRRVEALLQYPIKELDLRLIASYSVTPILFIIGSDDEKVFTSETLEVYDASATEKKELFLVKNAGNENIAKAAGEPFYNRIAAFLISSMPKEQKTTRYKKLAFE